MSEKPDVSKLPSPTQWTEDKDVVVKTYSGGCHCRRFTYTFDYPDLLNSKNAGISPPVASCNCSICFQRGYLTIFTPDERFKFTSGESAGSIGKYRFNTMMGEHRFCPTCGSGIVGTIPGGSVIVNVRTIDGITKEDLERIEIKNVDGRKL